MIAEFLGTWPFCKSGCWPVLLHCSSGDVSAPLFNGSGQVDCGLDVRGWDDKAIKSCLGGQPIVLQLLS